MQPWKAIEKNCHFLKIIEFTIWELKSYSELNVFKLKVKSPKFDFMHGGKSL